MALKILFLSHKFYPAIGGIEVNSEILADAFHNAGHTVRLITWSRHGSERKFPYEVKRSPSLISLLQEHRWADLVYENNPCLRLSWPAYFFHKPVVVALHTWVSRADGSIKWQDKLKLRWLRRARSVIAVSDSIRRKCWPDATVIGNPYRADLFFTVNFDLKRNRDFVFVGRLVSDKGVDIAINAIHQVMMHSNSIGIKYPLSLTIIGDGPERKELENLVGRLHLKSSVTFTGWLKGGSLAACLNDHKYLLVPSVWEEPFGNVALEGMACGCIPIVSDGGGLPDAVGNAGLVFPRGNAQALASCIVRLLKDQDLQTKLRKTAADHLPGHIPQVIAAKYLGVINEAIRTAI